MSEQKKMSRRNYLKYVAGGAVVVAAAGVGYGLYAGSQAPTPPITQTATVTQGATVTGAPTTAAGRLVKSDWWTGQRAFDGDATAMLIGEYNEIYVGDHEVTQGYPGVWNDVYGKLTAAYKAGSGMPDGVMMHTSEIPIFGGNAAAPLDDLVKGPDGLDPSNYVKGAWDASFAADGKQYCVPWDCHCMSMYVNIDAHNKYNIEVPVEIASVDALVDYWRSIKKASGGKVYPTVLDTQTVDLWWMSIANYAEMDDFFTKDLTAPNIRTDKWNHAFEVYETIAKEKLAPASNSHTDLITMFGRGDVATNIYGPWMMGTWDSLPALTYTVCQLKWPIWGGSHAMYLTTAARAQKDREAKMWRWLKWMHRPANNGRYGEYSGMIPATITGQNYLGYKVNPQRQIYAAQSAYTKTTQPTLHLWEMMDIFNAHLSAMSLLSENAQQAQDAIEQELTKLADGN